MAGDWPSEDLLQLSQPLLRVQAVSETEKFSGDGRMIDSSVADFLLTRLVRQMNLTARAFSDEHDPPRNEVRYMPVICSMIPVFTSLSPGLSQLLDGEAADAEGVDYDGLRIDSVQQDDCSVSGFTTWSSEVAAKFHSRQAGEANPQEEQNRYRKGNDPEESAAATSGFDLSSCLAVHEGTSGSKTGVDFRFSCFNHSLGKLITLGTLHPRGLDIWPGDVSQILYYGCAGVIWNIAAGSMTPVPCIAAGIGWWASAEIDPIGYIQVKNKSVIKPSVEAFKSQVSKKCELLRSQGKATDANRLQANYGEKSVEELVAAFAGEVRARIREAARNLNEMTLQPVDNIFNPAALDKVKLANLLVGTASYSPRSQVMLRYPLPPNAKVSEDDRVFISGMVRMVYGDRVLNWSLDAVKEHTLRCYQAP